MIAAERKQKILLLNAAAETYRKDIFTKDIGMTGKVWLVGAGPGDPGLFTIKGLEVLQNAEVVVYDALIGDSVLTLIPVVVIFILCQKFFVQGLTAGGVKG
jgi:hypothetical protein